MIIALLIISVATVVVPRSVFGQGGPTVTGVGPWTQVGNYGSSSTTPGQGGIGTLGASCVVYRSYVYCIGGQNPQGTDISDVFYAQLTASGISGWTETTDYGATTGSSGNGGTGVEWPSCVESGDYVYCVAGATGAGIVSKVYYAQLSSSGVGPWTETRDYASNSTSDGSAGIKIFQLSCVADSGYIYCVGGGSGASSRVFYAQLSSSGVGPWMETTDYGAATGKTGSGGVPIGSNICVDNTGYIYCIGGMTTGYVVVSDVFSAPVSSSGVGAWTENEDYGSNSTSNGTGGTPIWGTACVVYYSYIICVGGTTSGHAETAQVFFAQDQEIVGWFETAAGPIPTYWDDCFGDNGLFGYMICLGQGSPDVYSAEIDTPTSLHHPDISTILSSKVITAGDSVFDTATLTGENMPAGGNVTYSYFSNGDCTGNPAAVVGTVDVTPQGGVPNSANRTFPLAGTYGFVAKYNGDANDAPVESDCEMLTVNPSSSGTTTTNKVTPILYTSLNPSTTINAGRQAYDSAGFVGGSLVTPAGGNVTYYRYSGVNCTGVQSELGTVFVNSNGSVPNSPYTTFPNAGTYYYSASYTGDSNNNPTASACEKLTVVPPSTSSSSSSTSSEPSSESSSTSTTSTTTTPTNPTPTAGNGELLDIGIGVLAVALLGGGYYFWRRGSKGGPTTPPPSNAPPINPTGTEPPQEASCCGPDVTDNVLGGMLVLLRDFFSWSKEDQDEHLSWLTNPLYFQNAWDIDPLKPVNPKDPNPTGYELTLKPFEGICMNPKDPCYPSVVFLNNCHHPQVVNYVMWGVLSKLGAAAGDSGYTSTTYSTLHYGRSGGIGDYQDQVAMAEVGWWLADSYLSMKRRGTLPPSWNPDVRNKYGAWDKNPDVGAVNKARLQSILEANQNAGRRMANCLKKCAELAKIEVTPPVFAYTWDKNRGK
jgi:hypothetical protein